MQSTVVALAVTGYYSPRAHEYIPEITPRAAGRANLSRTLVHLRAMDRGCNKVRYIAHGYCMASQQRASSRLYSAWKSHGEIIIALMGVAVSFLRGIGECSATRGLA